MLPPRRNGPDPFVGTGTTAVVAKKHGRRFIGIDIRKSQIEITKKRLALLRKEVTNVSSEG